MIIGMPINTFLAILIWPFVYIIAAIIIYNVMKRQDAMIDDSEFNEFPDEDGKGAKS